ncbi:MarR family winged helix-turn-helix transcriptional regulator [Metallococcus carri]|uniref:MarR family winged helix-turn-helix transcriptional regulator n=1 Tax=Metallococcus carri TaxID=1656884 RepID=UPI002E2C7731|nr:MarR family transcriptional regulator [Metallococcus carri]
MARAHHAERAVSKALSGTELAAAHWFILDFVASSPSSGMSEIAVGTGLPAPTLTRHMDRLVDRNFVYRVLDPADRRRVGLRLTERGEAFIDEHQSGVHEMLREVFGAADSWELEAVQRALAKG